MSLAIKKQIVEAWKSSPVTRHRSFSDKRLWSKQEEILWAVRNQKRIAVKSGNSVGKSFICADIVMDYLTTNYPSKVITTAPTFNQVEGILWKEISTYCRVSKIPIASQVLNTQLKFNDEWFAIGLSTNETDRFQGWHSPNLMVVIDEASGVQQAIWDATESLHPSKILAIGNPLDDSGPFYECFSSPLWHKISISCEECVAWQKEHGQVPGLVTQEWVEEQAQIYGKGSPWYDIHVRGEFPKQGSDSLISRQWVDDCRKLNLEELEEDCERVISCDVATKHGENETVVAYRYGHTYKFLNGYYRSKQTETTGRLGYEYLQNKASVVAIDSDGVGEGLSDVLQERKVPTLEFHGGYSAKAMDDRKFRNLRSQFYWVVAKKFEKGLYDLRQVGAKEYEILKNQLCAIRMKAPDGLGRFQIETKEDMLARGIKSPDYADAFMMAEYAFYMDRFSSMKEYKFR